MLYHNIDYNFCLRYCYTVVVNDTASEIAALNPFRYRSYYFDTETNLYFLKTRYYDPTVGRFITIDDISYLDSDTINGLNLYAYCGNNPVMRADPSGNFAISALLISLGIGAILGGIYGGISAAENDQNIFMGATIGVLVGAVTSIVTEFTSGALLIASTFAIGFGGDVLNQIILDNKKIDEVNVIQSFESGIINSILALPAKYLSSVSARANLSNFESIVFGTITNSPLLALGMALNIGAAKDNKVLTFGDLKQSFIYMFGGI